VAELPANPNILRLREGFPHKEIDDTVATYGGKGALSVHGAGSVPCDFRADQDADGRIQIVFAAISSIDFVSNLLSVLRGGVVALFQGTTDSGNSVSTRCVGGRALSLDPAGNATVYFLPNGLKLLEDGDSSTSSTFLITNFAFSPFTHLGEPPAHPPNHTFSLQESGHIVEVEIRPLNDYVDRIVLLQQNRRVLPTALLALKTASPMEPPWTHGVATKICHLISLAAGTSVDWLRAEGFDPSLEKRYCFHSAPPTRPFCSFPTVPIKDLSYQANTNILQRFLQSGLDRYATSDSRHLDSLIASFLDARLEGEFLETRGLKVAITLEIAKNEFAEALTKGEWETTMPSALRKRIREIAKSALRSDGIDPDTVTIVSETLAQLSRPSLRRVVNYMLKALNLSEEKSVIDAVIEIRNRLVHTGRFISQTDPTRTSKLGIADVNQEFYMLLSFVDRVLLRIFGHAGPKIDYSQSKGRELHTSIS